MSRKITLPGEDEVRRAKDHLVTHGQATGIIPTVVELARRVGLTNPTFWRYFPDIAREVADLRRNPAGSTDLTSATGNRLRKLELRNAELSRANRSLNEHLELAVANIQRLSLDNHQLRQELEATTNVTTLTPRNR